MMMVEKGIGISEEDQEKLWIPFALIRPGDAQEGNHERSYTSYR